MDIFISRVFWMNKLALGLKNIDKKLTNWNIFLKFEIT